MEPFFFGAGTSRLLGLYHPPSGAGSSIGVLICPPILGDYMRTHGCLRQLALNLAAKGCHVMRFDYSGTGDSSGGLEHADIETWCKDIELALAELRDISGATQLIVIGVRLGASLALLATQTVNGIHKLVLWDPVLSGPDYLSHLKGTYQNLIASHDMLPPEEATEAQARLTGYDLSDNLVNGIHAIQIGQQSFNQNCDISLLTTDQKLFDSGRCQAMFKDCRFVDYDCQWSTYSESIIFGQPIISVLTDAL